jgi:hypothetical protein
MLDAMSLAKWISDLRQLHDKAKAGKLSADEKQVYEAGRDQLARALVSAQHIMLKAGETPRQVLRVARSLQIDLALASGSLRTPTLDLSLGGFAVLLAPADVTKNPVAFSLRLPGGEPIRGEAIPLESKHAGSAVRASFAFGDLSDMNRERLEFVIFDTALSMVNV